MADKVKEIEEIIDKYLKAGKILSQVRSEAKDRIKVGVSLLEIAEFVENRAVELGADGSAFPCNISRNDEAAHATPLAGDETVFGVKMSSNLTLVSMLTATLQTLQSQLTFQESTLIW